MARYLNPHVQTFVNVFKIDKLLNNINLHFNYLCIVHKSHDVKMSWARKCPTVHARLTLFYIGDLCVSRICLVGKGAKRWDGLCSTFFATLCTELERSA